MLNTGGENALFWSEAAYTALIYPANYCLKRVKCNCKRILMGDCRGVDAVASAELSKKGAPRSRRSHNGGADYTRV